MMAGKLEYFPNHAVADRMDVIEKEMRGISFCIQALDLMLGQQGYEAVMSYLLERIDEHQKRLNVILFPAR